MCQSYRIKKRATNRADLNSHFFGPKSMLSPPPWSLSLVEATFCSKEDREDDWLARMNAEFLKMLSRCKDLAKDRWQMGFPSNKGVRASAPNNILLSPWLWRPSLTLPIPLLPHLVTKPLSSTPVMTSFTSLPFHSCFMLTLRLKFSLPHV